MKARTRTRKIVALVLACVLFITYVPIVFASDVIVPPPEDSSVGSPLPTTTPEGSGSGAGTGSGTGDNLILPPDTTFIPSEGGVGNNLPGAGDNSGNGNGSGTGDDPNAIVSR